MENVEYFVREIEYSCGDLNIHQATIGDVGHVVWDAALVLSKFMDTTYFKNNFSLNGKVVVELGAGTGIVSLLAAMLGGTVYATDLKELVPLMQKNINENRVGKGRGSIKAFPLKWGDSGKDLMLTQPPDIILIADCVYYEESLHPLVETVKSLCGPRTLIFISYEERNTEHKVALLENFFEITKKHFEMDEIPLHVQDPQYSSEDIHILKMKLKDSDVS